MKNYLIDRKENVKLNQLLTLGHNMSEAVTSMGNKKLFKPSEFEIDEFLGKTKIAIREVLKYFEKANDYDESIKAKLERLSDMEIIKLYDCKVAAELIFSIGTEYKKMKQRGKGFWSDPMFLGSYTLLELLLLMGVFGLVITMIYLF